MIGIHCKWVCKGCGLIKETQSPFWNKHVRKKIEEPNKCNCNGVRFDLIEIQDCNFFVEDKNAV